VMGRPYFFPVPGFALRLVFGEMATVLLEGQQAVPQRLLDAGYTFRFPTLEDTLRDLVG
jgi:NAD dependent epimerase/dehydratase family enzyme